MLTNTENAETGTVNVVAQADQDIDLAKMLQKFERKLVEKLEEKIDALEKKVKLARGTRRDIQPPKEVKGPEQVKDLAVRMEEHLRENISTIVDLVRFMGEPEAKIAATLKEFQKANRIHNVGREDHARWTWKVGESVPNADLVKLIKRLASDQPMYTWEMAEATGVRPVRINAAMVEIQRSSAKVINLGNGKTYRWFVIPETAKRVNLKSKSAEKSDKSVEK